MLAAPRLACVQVNGTSNALFTVGLWRSSNYGLWLLVTQAETGAAHKQWGRSDYFGGWEHAGRTLVHFNDSLNLLKSHQSSLLNKNTAGKLKINVKSSVSYEKIFLKRPLSFIK